MVCTFVNFLTDTYDDILGKRETRPFGTAAWRHFVPVLTTAIIEGKEIVITFYFVYFTGNNYELDMNDEVNNESVVVAEDFVKFDETELKKMSCAGVLIYCYFCYKFTELLACALDLSDE
jgi:hypothetical protein